MRGTTSRVPESDRTWPPDSFLGRLTEGERDALLALGGAATTYQASDTLLLDGDARGEFVVLIHQGQVKVVIEDERGNDYLIGVRTRGDLLGEMSYIDRRPRSASVVAISSVRATRIAWENLNAYMRAHPLVWMKIARLLADRLRESDQTGRELHSEWVAQRVARQLLTLADTFDERTGGDRTIPLSQVEVAQLTRAAEVTVNRVLREFRDRRVVRTEYRRLVVPCLTCLNRLATALAADPKHGAKSVLGCGGTQHRQRQ